MERQTSKWPFKLISACFLICFSVWLAIWCLKIGTLLIKALLPYLYVSVGSSIEKETVLGISIRDFYINPGIFRIIATVHDS